MACTEITHLQSMLKRMQTMSYFANNLEQINSILSSASIITTDMCGALQKLVDKAVSTQSMLPFEVDGRSNVYNMDDANVPSLLSLPMLGYMSANHAAYKTTRDFVMSKENPYWFVGTQAEAVGGPHKGYDMGWPMAMVTRAMTSTDDDEVLFMFLS